LINSFSEAVQAKTFIGNSKKELKLRKIINGIWSFSVHQIYFVVIGAVFYAVLGLATNSLQLPSTINVYFRPAVAIPLFFGVAFGPIVGFLVGFVGNIIVDFISVREVWIWWDIGVGLMGLITGLMSFSFASFKAASTLLKAERFVIFSVVTGMGVASLSEIWVSGADLNTVINSNFIPAVIADLINGLILVPILMIAYETVLTWSER
jgi:energy-coupling factor transport system substrate-specific component